MSWPQDLSKLTIEELAALHRDNEAWSKNLKLRVKILGGAKTAGDFSEDEYDSSMKAINRDIAECIRRGQLLGKL